MKIQLTNSVRCASNPNLAFFKGKIYRAEVATNQPRAFRLTKNGPKINKVFGFRPDGSSMLIEKGDFVIKQLMPHERESLVQNYLNSKIKPPHVKMECPTGFRLRENFRAIEEKEYEKFPQLNNCVMRTNDGVCNKFAKYVKEIKRPGKKTVRIGCCARHGTVKI